MLRREVASWKANLEALLVRPWFSSVFWWITAFHRAGHYRSVAPHAWSQHALARVRHVTTDPAIYQEVLYVCEPTDNNHK